MWKDLKYSDEELHINMLVTLHETQICSNQADPSQSQLWSNLPRRSVRTWLGDGYNYVHYDRLKQKSTRKSWKYTIIFLP